MSSQLLLSRVTDVAFFSHMIWEKSGFSVQVMTPSTNAYSPTFFTFFANPWSLEIPLLLSQYTSKLEPYNMLRIFEHKYQARYDHVTKSELGQGNMDFWGRAAPW